MSRGTSYRCSKSLPFQPVGFFSTKTVTDGCTQSTEVSSHVLGNIPNKTVFET